MRRILTPAPPLVRLRGPQARDKRRTPAEREAHVRLRVFARFQVRGRSFGRRKNTCRAAAEGKMLCVAKANEGVWKGVGRAPY